jgi:hypothetical protein
MADDARSDAGQQPSQPGQDPAEKQHGTDVTAGKGRKDEVGRSGIYPASGGNPPADAEIITPGELGHRNS